MVLASDYMGSLYISTDSGATWASTSAGVRQWKSVSVSSDGTVMAAAAVDTFTYDDANSINNGEFLYISTDKGGSWAPRGSLNQWQSVHVSAYNKNVLFAVAAGNPTGIFRSDDMGQSWQKMTVSAACSVREGAAAFTLSCSTCPCSYKMNGKPCYNLASNCSLVNGVVVGSPGTYSDMSVASAWTLVAAPNGMLGFGTTISGNLLAQDGASSTIQVYNLGCRFLPYVACTNAGTSGPRCLALCSTASGSIFTPGAQTPCSYSRTDWNPNWFFGFCPITSGSATVGFTHTWTAWIGGGYHEDFRKTGDFTFRQRASGEAVLYSIPYRATFSEGQDWTPATTLSGDAGTSVSFGNGWTFLTACAGGSSSHFVAVDANNNIFLSSDAGGTWVVTSAPAYAWSRVVCSSSGALIYATATKGSILVSRDGGATWATSF
jgi:hypothetical protein